MARVMVKNIQPLYAKELWPSPLSLSCSGPDIMGVLTIGLEFASNQGHRNQEKW